MADPNEKTDPSNAEDENQTAPSEDAGDAALLPKPKKKKKASAAAEGQSSEGVRDRNQRIRDEARGQRSAKREAQRRAVTRNLDAGEIMDDAFARSTHAAANWLKKNINLVQWIVLGGIAAWAAGEIYAYRQGKAEKRDSDLLATAIQAERGRVGSAEPSDDPESGMPESRPSFATAAERLRTAAREYQAVASSSSSSAAAILAKLGLAGILYDQGKYAEAKAGYQAVKDSALASQDKDVKARSIEGLGLSLESLNQNEAAEKAFRELENLDVPGFGALGLYHQARILYAGGKIDKAKELLTKAQEKLSKDAPQKELQAPSYLTHAVRELLQTIDPSAVSASPNVLTEEQMRRLQEAAGAGDGKMSPEKLDEILKQLSKKGRLPPRGPGAPPSPGTPPSAP